MVNSEKLRRRKKELKLSFDEIAEKTGYSRRAIISIFNGETLYPRMETIQAIAKVLMLNTEDLGNNDFSESANNKDTYVKVTNEEKELINNFRNLTPPLKKHLMGIAESLAKATK